MPKINIYNVIKVLKTFTILILLGSTALKAQDTELLHVQGNVYAFFSESANITVQVGNESIVFVDSPDPAVIPDMLALIADVAGRQMPASHVINTALDLEHISGNDVINTLGSAAGVGVFARGPSVVAAGGATGGVTLIAHENVLNRFYLTEHNIPALTLTTTYFTETSDFSKNGEAIIIYHMPNAHTDGDSIVHFRSSDVISTGDIFTPGQYPDIDIERGGNINGLVDALNFILELTVPRQFAEGGTYVVPGHGRLGDEIDVVEYRNMVYIIRERVQALIDRNMSLNQILDAQVTFDYDTEYGGHRGGPSAEEFVSAIYTSLTAKN